MVVCAVGLGLGFAGKGLVLRAIDGRNADALESKMLLPTLSHLSWRVEKAAV